MRQCEAIITPEQEVHVHGNANFGRMSPRDVIDEGILTYAFGYTSGHTMLQILQEHGLLTKRKSAGYDQQLTKKGYEYLRAMFHYAPAARVVEMCRGLAIPKEKTNDCP